MLPSAATLPGVSQLDRARARLLRAAGGLARPFVRDRSLRVQANAVLLLATSTALALVAPLPSLFLLPLVLGVPHLVADLRWLGPGLPAWRTLSRARIAVLVAGLALTGLTNLLWLGALTVLLAGVWAGEGPARRITLALPGVALLVASVVDPNGLRLMLAHGHHAVALALWWMLRPRGLRDLAWIGAVALVVALLLGGWLDTLLFSLIEREPRLGTDRATIETWLAPERFHDTAWRWVSLYALGQSLHYGVWLRLIPEDARASETPRTFRRSVEVLEDAIGRPAVWGAVALTLAIAIWGLVDWASAWRGYMRIAVFHAWLELTAALLIVRGRWPRPGTPP